jgi:hypothetical protein
MASKSFIPIPAQEWRSVQAPGQSVWTKAAFLTRCSHWAGTRLFPRWRGQAAWRTLDRFFKAISGGRKSGRNEIWKIHSAGGKVVQVTRNGGFVAFEAPDGRALFYIKTDQNAKLGKSAVDGSGETVVLDGVAYRGFVVAADRVYYLRQEPNGSFAIRRYMIATGEDSQIASLTKSILGGLSISPDGKYFIYSQRLEASNLMLVEDFH